MRLSTQLLIRTGASRGINGKKQNGAKQIILGEGAKVWIFDWCRITRSHERWCCWYARKTRGRCQQKSLIQRPPGFVGLTETFASSNGICELLLLLTFREIMMGMEKLISQRFAHQTELGICKDQQQDLQHCSLVKAVMCHSRLLICHNK